jgi:hypothetical protein
MDLGVFLILSNMIVRIIHIFPFYTSSLNHFLLEATAKDYLKIIQRAVTGLMILFTPWIESEINYTNLLYLFIYLSCFCFNKYKLQII